MTPPIHCAVGITVLDGMVSTVTSDGYDEALGASAQVPAIDHDGAALPFEETPNVL
jgi:hypothetical protein